MKRRYRSRHYEDRLLKAYALMPDAAYGADLMTGFPGETDAEFGETYEFVRRMPYTYLHVFTYSERPGTPAASSNDHVPHPVRKERTRLLRELAAQKNLEFRQRMVCRTLSAVTLDNGKALTENYLNVEMAVPRVVQHHGHVIAEKVRVCDLPRLRTPPAPLEREQPLARRHKKTIAHCASPVQS
jgi:threonylcarbamoyladenosine tRNA methylthiotransferase MtaB